MINPKIVIAIDGPAGAGKSTVSKILANKLNLRYLDTGAMYRVVALIAHRRNLLSFADQQKLVSLLDDLKISFEGSDPQRVLLSTEDVTDLIRLPELGQIASKLSTIPVVRSVLVRNQQELLLEGGMILEGRDVTTVVAPRAELKIYLTASLEERAQRRLTEFTDKGLQSNFISVRSEIEERDHRDITRNESPLAVAEGAIIIDSANMTIKDVVEKITFLASNAS